MKKIGILLAALVALVGIPSAASAAKEAAYKITYCYSGSNVGIGTNSLSNGTVRAGWCNSGSKATTITVKYEKNSGSAVSVQFGYRWTNSDGGNIGGTHYDSTGSVTVKAGKTWSARFKRDPAQSPPDGQKCIQGLIKVKDQGVFPTHTICR